MLSKNNADLFQKAGSCFYEEVRTKDHKKWNEIQRFINCRYHQNITYVDKDLHKKLPNEFEQMLWELTVCDFLRNHRNITLLQRKSYASKNVSIPDLCFSLNGKRYFVECVTVGPGSCEKLSISLEDALGVAHLIPRDEYKKRFFYAIRSKIEIYKNQYRKNMQEDDGFIIAVSSGRIGLHINPNDPLIEKRFLYGESERIYNPTTGEILNIDSCKMDKKPNNCDDENNNGYFVDDEHKYLTSVLSSRDLAVCFSGSDLDLFGIPRPNEEFILSHNPFAINKLPEKILTVQDEHSKL